MLDVVKSIYLYFYLFKINSNFSKNIYQYGEHWLPLILGVSCKLGGPPPNMRGRF